MLHERLWAPAVLLVGLLLSGWAGLVQQHANQQEVADATRDLANRVVDRATAQLGRAALNLRGVRAYLAGAATTGDLDQVDSAQFRSFAQSHDLHRAAPGVTSVGVIRRVAPTHEAAYIAHQQRHGSPGFARVPLGPNDGERRIVQWIEPAEANRGIAGIDVASETARRRASDLALQTDEPILTSPIQLQATPQARANNAMGLLMMLRLPEGRRPPGQGIASGAPGLVYSRIELDELLRAAELRSDLVGIRVVDVSDPAKQADFRLPVSQPDTLQHAAAITLERRVMGREWRFTVTPRVAFIDSLHQVPPLVHAARLAAGTGLLALLVATWVRLRRRTQDGLAERTRLLTMLDHASDAVVGLDLQGRVTMWNRAAERLFGYRAEEALGQPLSGLTLAEEHVGEEEQLIRAALDGRATTPFETRRRHRNGTMLDVEVSAGPMYDADGQVVGVVKLLRAVHERVEQRRQLQAWGERLESEVAARTRQLATVADDLRNVLDALPSRVSAWDAQMRNRFANTAFVTWTGRTPAELVGMTAEEVLGSERFNAELPQVLAALAGRACSFEHRTVDADGQWRHVVVNLVPHREHDQVVGFYALTSDVTDFKRAEQRLSDIIEGTQAGTWEWDCRSNRLAFNARWATSMGLRPADLQDATTALWARLAHPDDHAAARAAIRAHCQGLTPAFECETRMRHRDGSWVWTLTRGKVVARAPDGQPLTLAGLHLDITERKQAEQALRDSQAMLARTGQIAQIGGWSYEVSTGMPRWSDETCRIHGLPAGQQPTLDEALGHYTADSRPTIQALVERALAHAEPWDAELQILRADGQVRWVRVIGECERQPDGGRVQRLVGTVQDITVQRANREAAEQAQRMLQAAVDAVDGAFVVFDPDDRLVLCNEKYRDMNSLLADVIVPGATFESIIRAGVERGQYMLVPGHEEAWVQECLAAHRAGNSRRTQEMGNGRIMRIVDRQLPDGHVVGFRVDITELEQARRAAESASRAKSDFLASTSHEIRTPLHAVLGLAYLLERADLPPAQLAQVRQIGQAGRALLALVNEVLDLSKIEAGQLALDVQDVDLRAVARESMDLLAGALQAKQLHTTVEVDPAVPAWVRADGARLRQILHNLLGNALKFTERGSVGLQVRPAAQPPGIVLEVRDTGIGIDPAIQAQLFQPFVQADASISRRYGGTGLGLSIVARLAALMDGEVRVASTPGVGSCFTVTVPLPPLPAGTPAPAPGPALELPAPGDDRARLAGQSILVVDDNTLNQEVARKVLELEDARITTCSSGGEALAMLQDPGRDFDAVLLDIEMPGMDGITLARHLRASPASARLPLIALSAGVLRDDRDRALAAGMDAFMSKPLEPERLIACLRQHIARYRGQPVPLRPRRAGPAAAAAAGPALDIAGLDPSQIAAPLLADRPLLLSMLRRMLDEHADIAGDSPERLPARLHKLRGSALVVGATAVAGDAAALERALVHGGRADAPALQQSLRASLLALREAASATLQAEAGRLAAAEAAEALRQTAQPPLDEAARLALQALIDSQSVRAAARVEALAGPIAARWGTPRLARLRSALAEFDFQSAAALVQA